MSSAQRQPLAASITLVTLIIAGLVLVLPSACRVEGRRSMAEHVSNAKQIKLGLDSFAMDNDGRYPTDKTAPSYKLPAPEFSNDYFHQLFASGNVDSERIFWAEKSRVCSKKQPDDVTTTSGKFDPAQTLRPGDNHWAYFNGLKNISKPSLPIVVDSYLPGTTTFDKKLRDNKVIALRVDGSARPEQLSSAGTILDRNNKNLLTTDSELWNDTTPDLRQPDPATP